MFRRHNAAQIDWRLQPCPCGWKLTFQPGLIHNVIMSSHRLISIETKLDEAFWNTYVQIASIRSESIVHYHFHLLFDTIRFYSRQLTDSKVALMASLLQRYGLTYAWLFLPSNHCPWKLWDRDHQESTDPGKYCINLLSTEPRHTQP